MIVVFLIGYFLIVFEHIIHINKATIALLMGVLCWTVLFVTQSSVDTEANLAFLQEHLANVSQVVIFLLGAMIIIEIMSAHQGFKLITQRVLVNSKRKLLWMIGLMSFLLSAVLDNLTTTIVMISIIQKILDDPQDRLIFGGGIVIAANAGGTWTPIGDVTTTMLWIGGQLSTFNIITKLLIPSLVCFIVSFACLSGMVKGKIVKASVEGEKEEPFGPLIFLLGLSVLMFVPVFKLLTGLPPFLGMVFGLSVMWLVTDIIHYKEHNRNHLRVLSLLPKVDLSGLLFFLGILLAVHALETAGILKQLSVLIERNISNSHLIATLIGLASSVIDNIPLVAAAMGMYDLSQYPMDASFWQLIAYCAGTGGSILIIGSAAGVVYMSMEKIDFFSYLKKISVPALAGYFAGILVYFIIF